MAPGRPKVESECKLVLVIWNWNVNYGVEGRVLQGIEFGCFRKWLLAVSSSAAREWNGTLRASVSPAGLAAPVNLKEVLVLDTQSARDLPTGSLSASNIANYR